MNFATILILAQTPGPKPVDPGLQTMNTVMMVVFFIAIMYFMMIRPQAKKQKELTARISALKTGDRVVTTGGIYGTVANVKDGATLLLKIADNVKIEIDKSAVANVITPDPAKPANLSSPANA